MKHDKLFLVRILCLIGIAGELLIPNNIIRMLFGLFFAIISVALLLMHKNDIILEESDRKNNPTFIYYRWLYNIKRVASHCAI